MLRPAAWGNVGLTCYIHRLRHPHTECEAPVPRCTERVYSPYGKGILSLENGYEHAQVSRDTTTHHVRTVIQAENLCVGCVRCEVYIFRIFFGGGRISD